jgi:endonuclease YncB( thermonuclease family)
VRCPRAPREDAPERGQAFGRPAKQLLSSLVFKRVVHVVPVDIDRYDRLVARVLVDSSPAT